MKGQTMVFEQFLLFTMGVILFVMLAAVFMIYQSYFEDVTVNDQLRVVRDSVASNVIKLSEKGESEATVEMEIPRTIGNGPYSLELNQNGLMVSTPDEQYANTPLFGLGSQYVLGGSALSTEGLVVIYRKGDNIIIS